jgi:hypothetical protein
MPGFRENPLFGAYCGMLQFITYSGSLAAQGAFLRVRNQLDPPILLEMLLLRS